ncbi:hypothetical protein N9937_01410 [bacterium]|nr:hypothetical protein [bacterium]
MSRRSWVQCPDTGKLIPKEEWNAGHGRASYIMGDIDPFVSPIDGRLISGRVALRQHNAEHGVTDSRDYSPDYIAKRAAERGVRAKGQTKQDKHERINLIRKALDERT